MTDESHLAPPSWAVNIFVCWNCWIPQGKEALKAQVKTHKGPLEDCLACETCLALFDMSNLLQPAGIVAARMECVQMSVVGQLWVCDGVALHAGHC